MKNSLLTSRMTLVYLSQPSSVALCIQKSVFSIRISSLSGSQTSPICFFCIQNSDFSTRIASLYGSQTSPVVICLQNNVISIRITGLYGSQPSFMVSASKTATLGPELQVSMCPRPYLPFLHSQHRHYVQN